MHLLAAQAAPVPAYRIYSINQAGHISGPPEIVECPDDQEAAQIAKLFIDGKDVEVWDGPRFVVGLKAAPRKQACEAAERGATIETEGETFVRLRRRGTLST